ncbi:hypothetical protein HFD88_008114 [Aspergillus terreus]|nr:hypothetical protein HFD88_008114 [Aspergillus terreus]
MLTTLVQSIEITELTGSAPSEISEHRRVSSDIESLKGGDTPHLLVRETTDKVTPFGKWELVAFGDKISTFREDGDWSESKWSLVP